MPRTPAGTFARGDILNRWLIDLSWASSRLEGQHNLCPLSFIDVPQQDYVDAMLGIYELNRTELLRDVFVWAYGRSPGCRPPWARKTVIASSIWFSPSSRVCITATPFASACGRWSLRLGKRRRTVAPERRVEPFQAGGYSAPFDKSKGSP
jgi:hypothetical protein